MATALTAYCPHYHRAVEIIGQRWSPEIIRALLAGKVRFSEIGSAIPGLSDRMLSERLKMFDAEAIVSRKVVPSTPVRVEYRLTPKGAALAAVVGALAQWAETWVPVQATEPSSTKTG